MPSGWTGSITHKAGWAFAAAAPSHVGTIGLDSEIIGTRERLSIAARVLRPAELTRWRAAGADWPSLLRSFSVKEAIYKALHPWVPRYIGFHEAEVAADGSISMHLDGGEGDFVFASVVETDADRLLSFVRVRPT
jgi:4'-phosphopantetheinyl transferase EntD